MRETIASWIRPIRQATVSQTFHRTPYEHDKKPPREHRQNEKNSSLLIWWLKNDTDGHLQCLAQWHIKQSNMKIDTCCGKWNLKWIRAMVSRSQAGSHALQNSFCVESSRGLKPGGAHGTEEKHDFDATSVMVPHAPSAVMPPPVLRPD
jgi:hypothetical protein